MWLYKLFRCVIVVAVDLKIGGRVISGCFREAFEDVVLGDVKVGELE